MLVCMHNGDMVSSIFDLMMSIVIWDIQKLKPNRSDLYKVTKKSIAMFTTNRKNRKRFHILNNNFIQILHHIK